MVLLAAAIVALGLLLIRSNSKIEESQTAILRLQDSVTRIRSRLTMLETRTPGLGEYMTAMQLHYAKLWIAAMHTNWDLAHYELDELAETMEGAESLDAVKDSVHITPVLHSVRTGILPQLDTAITRQDAAQFKSAYTVTLSACNNCHTASSHPFIHIEEPHAEPVTNQRWDRQ